MALNWNDLLQIQEKQKEQVDKWREIYQPQEEQPVPQDTFTNLVQTEEAPEPEPENAPTVQEQKKEEQPTVEPVTEPVTEVEQEPVVQPVTPSPKTDRQEETRQQEVVPQNDTETLYNDWESYLAEQDRANAVNDTATTPQPVEEAPLVTPVTNNSAVESALEYMQTNLGIPIYGEPTADDLAYAQQLLADGVVPMPSNTPVEQPQQMTPLEQAIENVYNGDYRMMDNPANSYTLGQDYSRLMENSENLAGRVPYAERAESAMERARGDLPPSTIGVVNPQPTPVPVPAADYNPNAYSSSYDEFGDVPHPALALPQTEPAQPQTNVFTPPNVPPEIAELMRDAPTLMDTLAQSVADYQNLANDPVTALINQSGNETMDLNPPILSGTDPMLQFAEPDNPSNPYTPQQPFTPPNVPDEIAALMKDAPTLMDTLAQSVADTMRPDYEPEVIPFSTPPDWRNNFELNEPILSQEPEYGAPRTSGYERAEENNPTGTYQPKVNTSLPEVPDMPPWEYFGTEPPQEDLLFPTDFGGTSADPYDYPGRNNGYVPTAYLRENPEAGPGRVYDAIADFINANESDGWETAQASDLYGALPRIDPETPGAEILEQQRRDSIDALIRQIKADDELVDERPKITGKDVKDVVDESLQDIRGFTDSTIDFAKDVTAPVTKMVEDWVNQDNSQYSADYQRYHDAALRAGLYPGTAAYENYINQMEQAERQAERQQAEYNALVESQNVDKNDVAEYREEQAERDRELRDRTQAEFEALIESQNPDRADIEEVRRRAEILETGVSDRIADLIMNNPNEYAYNEKTGRWERNTNLQPQTARYTQEQLLNNPELQKELWNERVGNERLMDDLMQMEAPAVDENGNLNTAAQALFMGLDENDPFSGTNGQLTKDEMLHLFDRGRFTDPDSGVNVEPEFGKLIATMSPNALQNLGLVNPITGKPYTETVNLTMDQYDKMVDEFLNANPLINALYKSGMLTEQDIANNFFKNVNIVTGKPKGSGSGYGSGYGGYGGRGYSGGGGGGGSRSSGSSGASAKSQTEQRINNIMKNWTF